MCPSVLDPHISAVGITNLSETFVKPGEILTPHFERCSMKKPDHGNRLLRARRDRPRRRRAAEQRDELAALHSITSSAATSSLSGTMRPSILAVWALITNSNLLACTTGRSAGLAPFRMRPV